MVPIYSSNRSIRELPVSCFEQITSGGMTKLVLWVAKSLEPGDDNCLSCVVSCLGVSLLLLFSHWVVSDSFSTPSFVAHQAPLSMGFSRKEYWSALSFPSPGDLPELGIEPATPALQVDSLRLSHWEITDICICITKSHCCIPETNTAL